MRVTKSGGFSIDERITPPPISFGSKIAIIIGNLLVAPADGIFPLPKLSIRIVGRFEVNSAASLSRRK
jgi:hypothetical protein